MRTMRWIHWPRRKAELETRSVLRGISDRLSVLESTPIPDPHLPRVDALEANVESVGKAVATLAGNLGQTDLVASNNLSTVSELDARITALGVQVKDQTHAISEGIERTARAERRVSATVARARKELESRGYTDPGLDAEDRELHLVDGGRGEPVGLQPVSQDVEADGQRASSIPGVTIDELTRARRA